MKYILLLIILIAVLAYVLNKRGSSGLGGTKTETTQKALGQSHRNDGPGGPTGFGGGI
jgi:hypothetical protein